MKKYIKSASRTIQRSLPTRREAAAAAVAGAITGALGKKAVQAMRGMTNPVVKDKRKRKRRRTVYRKKGGVRRQTKKLAKQVRDLSKKVNNGQGILTYYARDAAAVIATANTQSYSTVASVGVGQLETALAELRFFNPSAPGTLIQGSGASGTYSRKYMFDVYGKLHVRNNYQVPCIVTIYTCVVKDDTSITPTVAFTQGLVDVGNPSNTSQLLYLTHSPQFNQLWKIASTKRLILQAGQELDMTHSTGKFQYDPALTDSHADDFQAKNKAFAFVVRVDGVLAHDSSAAQYGFSAGGVDCVWTFKYTIRYEAGVDISYIVVADAVDSFTNGALVSSYPIADNIGYSAS